MALTKAKLIADNAVKAVHIDETDTGITLAQLNVTGDITTSSGTITASAFVGDGSGITGVSSDYTVSEISTNTTAVANNLYVLTASLTLTLPASPSVGDKVAVSNMSGTTTPVVARNGSLILGLAEDLTINVENISVEFIYSGATEGWVVFTDSILGYASVDTIDGSGTTNYISKWSATDTLTDSIIFDNGTNVGIGTTSPAGNLHIATTGNATLILEGDTDNVGDSDTQVDATIRMMTDGGTNWWDIEAVNRSQNAGNLNFNFTGGGSAKIGLFTDLPAMELDVVGRVRASQGIYFGSDTAAANALDDYEEGTFTPTAFGASSAGTTTYIYQNGLYTKIGRQVNIHILIGWSSMTGTGDLIIGGVPFTPINSQNINYLGSTLTDGLNWNPNGSTIVCELQRTTSNIVLVALNDDQFLTQAQQCVNETAYVRVTLTYYTS